MKYQITYWTLGDSMVTRVIEADSIKQAVEMLRDDPQEPLCQIISVSLVDK